MISPIRGGGGQHPHPSPPHCLPPHLCAGTYGTSGGTCVACPLGTYNPLPGTASSAACLSCEFLTPAGAYCAPGSKLWAGTPCPAGSSCAGGAAAPVACAAGELTQMRICALCCASACVMVSVPRDAARDGHPRRHPQRLPDSQSTTVAHNTHSRPPHSHFHPHRELQRWHGQRRVPPLPLGHLQHPNGRVTQLCLLALPGCVFLFLRRWVHVSFRHPLSRGQHLRRRHGATGAHRLRGHPDLNMKLDSPQLVAALEVVKHQVRSHRMYTHWTITTGRFVVEQVCDGSGLVHKRRAAAARVQ